MPKSLTWKTRTPPDASSKVAYTLISATAYAHTDVPDKSDTAPPVTNDSHEWSVLVDLTPTKKDFLGTRQATVPAPVTAQGTMEFTATLSQTNDNDGPLYAITMILAPNLVHEVTPAVAKQFQGQYASSRAKGTMKVKMAAAVMDDPNPKRKGRVDAFKFPHELTLKSEGNSKKANDKHTDPVVLEVEQVGVGIIASEQLFWLESGREGFAALTWNDVDGLVLLAAPLAGSRAYIAGDYPSSWVTSAIGPFSATLEDGVFTATGALAGLPWEFTPLGDLVLQARLPPAAVPDLALDYEIPESLFSPGELYAQSLSSDSDLTGSDECCHFCPADYNQDYFVDGIDYDLFNNDFESPDPLQQLNADYNGDGFVDGIDADLFNNDFEAGC